MRVLVTGSSGFVGAHIREHLAGLGYDVVPYDLREGRDILDRRALQHAAAGCDAVVHAAALLEPVPGNPQRLPRVNVEGTANVLVAAEAAGAGKIIYLSGLSVLGVFRGHRAPDYLPLGQDHPCYPSTDYERSKFAAERLCSEFAASGRGSVVTLRTPGVWAPASYGTIRRAREQDPKFEWHPYWE